MKLTFWGAARTVTGSLHLLEASGTKVALDCGLFQGRRADQYTRNNEFPCAPSELSAVVLSHAHLDHIGNLPNLVKKGFAGPIYSNHPTAHLARALLLDSAYIQEKDVVFVNKQRARRHEPPVQPLYTVEDAEKSLQQFTTVGMHREICYAPHICGQYYHAGHILGSTVVELEIEEKGRTHALIFSGDIGRKDMILMPPTEIPGKAQTLIVESTYGNRRHESTDDLCTRLLDIVKRTADRGGKVIIPAFSVGRTQEIVYRLNELFNSGALPRIPIYVDSPLSLNVTQVFRQFPEYYNREAHDAMRKDPDIFGFETLRYTQSVEESKALNDNKSPMVIIAGSGMCEAGRVVHHLHNSVENPKNTVLIVGFQAPDTLGRRLVEKREKIRIFGMEHTLRAEVQVLNGFSAHADSEELKDFIFQVRERSGGALQRVFLVHGDPEAQESLATYVRDFLKLECHIPDRGDSFELH